MNTSVTAIMTSSLSKRFGGGLKGREVKALIDVSLEVYPGEIFGLLGPNGAGKTTMVKILLGSLRPTSGSASINGHDCLKWEARRRVGFLPENHRFPPYQTGLQMLYHFGGMAGMGRDEIKSRADDLLKLVDMSRWGKTRIKKYSKGMMQRLGLAQAMLSDPDLIFLDEPTDGVDPIGRREIRDVLLSLKKQGKTIFLNSHLLAEVEAVCDRVAILDKGKLIKVGPVSGLIGGRPSYKIETRHLSPEVADRVSHLFPESQVIGPLIAVTFDDNLKINALIDLLRSSGVELISVIPQKASLEDSFMQLIRGGAAGE